MLGIMWQPETARRGYLVLCSRLAHLLHVRYAHLRHKSFKGGGIVLESSSTSYATSVMRASHLEIILAVETTHTCPPVKIRVRMCL